VILAGLAKGRADQVTRSAEPAAAAAAPAEAAKA
jgi:hypothetical protein